MATLTEAELDNRVPELRHPGDRRFMYDFIDALTNSIGVTATTTELNQLDASTSDGASIAFSDTQLSATEINDLKDTNIELLAAPAPGLAAVPISIHIFHDHGGADFVQGAGTDHLAIRYNAGIEIAEIGTAAECTTLVEASADASLYFFFTDGYVPEAATAIDMDNNGATDYTTGDGTFSVRLYYRMAAFS